MKVEQQGEVLVQAEEHAENAVEEVIAGNAELEKANTYQVSSKKKMIIFIVIIVFIFIVIAVVLAAVLA
jgi:t-SNARE complex subunit (syntaxin)